MELGIAEDRKGPIPRVIQTALRFVVDSSAGRACIILPDPGELPALTAAAWALTQFRKELPSILALYGTTNITIGTRVKVLPSGWVYNYLGVSDTVYGSHFRLGVLHARSPTSRTLPLAEILRLQPTTQRTPRGKENSNLLHPIDAPIDRLLGVSTCGNTSVYRNYVFMQNRHQEVSDVLARYSLFRGGPEGLTTMPLADLPMGNVLEDGTIQWTDRSISGGQPLIAVGRTLGSLSEAVLQSTSPPLTILETSVGVSDFGALDAICSRGRVLVFGRESDFAVLNDLRERGFRFWRPNRAAVIETLSHGASLSDLAPMAARALYNRSRCKVRCKPVDHVEMARGIASLDRIELPHDPNEQDDAIDAILGEAWGLALRTSDLYAPSHLTLSEIYEWMESLRRRTASVGYRFSPEDRASMEGYLDAIAGYLVGLTAGWSPKVPELAKVVNELLSKYETVGVLARRQSGVDELRGMEQYLEGARVLTANPSAGQVDGLVISAWLGASRMRELLLGYPALEVVLLGFPFECRFLATTRLRFDKLCSVTDFESFESEGSTLTWPETSDVDLDPGLPDGVLVDPKPRIIERRRKGHIHVPSGVPVRTARYVDFAGPGYAYITPGHDVPVVNDFVDRGQGSQGRLAWKDVEGLKLGDSVLFRDRGEADILGLIAADIEPRYWELRELSGSWRAPLLAEVGRCGTGAVHHRFREAGGRVQRVAFAAYVGNEDLIGPGRYEDLIAVLLVSHPDFQLSRASSVWEAIQRVRALHVAAGARLTTLLLKALAAEAPTARSGGVPGRHDLGIGQVWIVVVEEIAPACEDRPASEVNRLLWEGG